ncbi:hypothetical protein GCM10011533_18870 [Streptosporangium jomthongense]|nr:lipoprotein [Marinobacter aromaticivorans]GGE66771.1 hypothetical protein GCM10011533_18870 [Streptosporangium jomthongense]
MRTITLPVAILVAVAALAGCGQKGPLYRDTPEAVSGSAGESDSLRVQNEHPDERNPRTDTE